MQWNLQSNACDVLSLGPRTAGRLATVGIYTVAELLAAKPPAVTQRLGKLSIAAATMAEWQCEARLIVALPQLSPLAARMLAAAGFSSAEKIRHCTPTELIAAIETARQMNPAGWLAQETLPTVSEVSSWINIAGQKQKSCAA